LGKIRPGGNTEPAERLEQVDAVGVEYGIVGYTHAGGVDRPLVAYKTMGGNAGAVVVPHMNWRGLFSLGTNPSGGASTTPIEWPGFRTTAWHSQGETQGATKNWMGSLLEGQRDAGGLMYMRNRYYDPATGQFTQTDPIGIAGGLNTYGFAAGDPVSYSDPFGLKVECKTQAACDTWGRVYSMAVRASESSDEVEAMRGQEMVNMMIGLLRDEETLVISVENVGWWNRLRNRGNGTSPCEDVPRICQGRGDYGLLVDPAADHGRNVSKETRFAHEIGHAYAYMVLGATSDSDQDDRRHEYQSVRSEDLFRSFKGCQSRNFHYNKSPRNC
jgi:RHS repeat-associated protein